MSGDVPSLPYRSRSTPLRLALLLLGSWVALAGLPRPASGQVTPHRIHGDLWVQPSPGPGGAFLASALVPGLGQYRQGQRRWLAYAAIEALFVGAYFSQRSRGRTLRNRYRDVAWDLARIGVSTEPRADGSFRYYETLAQWERSGAWDLDAAAGGIQPEVDATTFNGSIWALASQIYNLDPADPEGSPGYDDALGFYMERGYGSAFLWDWRSAPGEQGRFAGLIDDSDARFRRARQAVGVLIANHLLSGIDGFISARLSTAHGVTQVGFQVPLGPI